MKLGRTPREPKREPDRAAQRALLERLREKRTRKLIAKSFSGEISHEKKIELNRKANSVINETIMKIISMSRKRRLKISKRVRGRVAQMVLREMKGLDAREQYYFLASIIRKSAQEIDAAIKRKEGGREIVMRQLLKITLQLSKQRRFLELGMQ